MRMVSSPGKSIRRRREICLGLHALAHRRCCRRPCRRPFQATAGPTTAAPPGVATAPDRRSCTYVRSAAVVASFALFGRRPARSACHCAVLARYATPPPRVAALRRNSREIVDAARPSRRAISRMPWPCARHSAISSRSANTRYRSDGGFADGASVVGGKCRRWQVSSVACRPPPGTSGPPPRATHRPLSPRPRSTDPPQSPPRTAAGSPAAPRLVGQATPATRLVAPDPSAVPQPSSQPPPSRCCDDHLNPGWIPLYEILDQRGFEVVVVNARDAKHVPGRKTDVSDAAWLERLHEYGLLRASFRPKGEIATLRSYLRQRERLLDQAAAHIQHMQKALTEMNLQLHHVVADVTGVTGLRILRALVAGERDPDTLAAYSDPRCKAPAETLRAALVGNYREEHVFALAQALELYDIYQAKVAACDQRIEAVLERLKAANPPPAAALPPARPRRRQANEPGFVVREALHAILGADPTQIDGIGPSLALTLVGECGTDLSAWPSAKHFTSWLSLAPHNKISGGKVLSARTRRSGSRAAALLRLAAVVVGRTATALGAFYSVFRSRCII